MDIHSFNSLTTFANPDLHIDRRQNVCIEMTGTPISGITMDIDGEQRNLQTPDIGADEFDCIVSEVANEFIADEYSLEQNYPNPFNPSTKISYFLSTGGNVTLKVFDILGNEIAILVNEEKPAGKYEINFNANNLSSGVYIYTIQAANFVESKKMLLIK
ncbi:MAG: T9SS type A sorting domain-containing protein [bacterium]|nr:T9SS type A sorting domain-containing protein [bacterium]